MAAIISEHEAMPAGPNQVAPDQPPENQDIVQYIQEILKRSKRYRKRYDADWRANYEFVCSGRQWALDRARWRFNESVNIVWSAVMTEIALQTDARPKFEYTAQEFGDEAFVDVLKDVNDSNWSKYKWSGVVQDALFDCKIYHVAHAIVEWNEDMEFGLGDVDFRILDPYYCFWDPQASDVNKGKPCRWFLYTEPVTTSKLKMDYPDQAADIKADAQTLDARKEITQGMSTTYMNFDPYTPTRLPTSAAATGEIYGGEPMTMLIRAWLRDDTLEEICVEKDDPDPKTGEPDKEYILKKKYPNGRYIEMANNRLLRDGPIGCEVGGEWVAYENDTFPIARLVNYSYPREYAGENEVTHTKGPQKVVNYIWSYILDMFRMQSNPVTVIGDAANVDEEEITNEPGLIIKAADINQIRREPGTPIAAGSLNLLQAAEALLDKVQGLQDVSRGADTPAATSGVMLEGYLEAAQTRPRMKNRNLDLFLQDAGELTLSRYLQFYTKPRVFRITNKDGYPDYIEFYMSTMQDVHGKSVKMANIQKKATMPDGSQQIQPQTQIEVKGAPDVRVQSGSALPYAKAQKAQNATMYFKVGAIDQEELLKAVDWPNWEVVLRRMQDAAQKAAEQQQQQGGGGPPPASK